MKISIIEQEVNDFDWFMVSEQGQILHFTSGGGRLPLMVCNSFEDLEFIKHFFYDLNSFDENNNLIRLSDTHKEMARKGLYSFDRLNLDDPTDTRYSLLHSPENELSLNDLPMEIQLIMKEFKIDFNPLNQKSIDIGYLTD